MRKMSHMGDTYGSRATGNVWMNRFHSSSKEEINIYLTPVATRGGKVGGGGSWFGGQSWDGDTLQ